MRGLKKVGLWAVALMLLPQIPGAQEEGVEFYRYRVKLHDEFAAFYTFDLTGNGMQDLIVVEIDRLQREPIMFVSVFLHTPDGFRRTASPTRMPSSLALAGVGNFVGGPGLVILIPHRVEIWLWRDGRFHGEDAAGLDVDSIFPVEAGEVRSEVDLLVDLNGDGLSEIVVPGFDGLRVIQQMPDGSLQGKGFLRVRPHTRFWNSLTYRAVIHDVPSLHYVDFDGNGWLDVVAFSDGQLYWYAMDESYGMGERTPYLVQDFRPPKPFDPTEPWDPPLRLIKVADLNQDGVPDLVFSKNAPTDSVFTSTSSTLIYYGVPNEEGTLDRFPADADQVFVSEGFTLPIMVDIDGDRRIDLVQVNVEVTFWNAIRALIARSVKAEAAYYLMGAKGRYPDEPVEMESYSVKFSLNRFGHQPIATHGDLNGDGLPDLLLSADKEELGIHWGRKEIAWDSDYDEVLQEFLPIHQKRLYVRDLNMDGRDDLILTYIRSDNRQMPETVSTLIVLLSNFPAPPLESAASR